MISKYSGSTITRRMALQLSGTTLAGLGPLGLTALGAQGRKPEPPPADRLVEQKLREIAPLPLNSDGAAKEFSETDLTPVDEIGVIYRNSGGKPPQIELDPAKHKIRIRGNVVKYQGGLGLSDLKKLPAYTQITKLQCGAAKPSGIIKWSGVRFADVCRTLLQAGPMCQYVMFVGADGYITTEDMSVATHPQTILAWEMNGGPIPPVHGAPFRLVIPTRWAGRHIKAIEEIRFTATSFGYNNG